jgi:hypothetical protein
VHRFDSNGFGDVASALLINTATASTIAGLAVCKQANTSQQNSGSAQPAAICDSYAEITAGTKLVRLQAFGNHS